MAEIEQKARQLALFYGGRLSHARPGEGFMTNAYLAGKRAGWWQWGRGVNTPELLDEYVDRHWRDFIEQASTEAPLETKSLT